MTPADREPRPIAIRTGCGDEECDCLYWVISTDYVLWQGGTYLRGDDPPVARQDTIARELHEAMQEHGAVFEPDEMMFAPAWLWDAFARLGFPAPPKETTNG